MHAFELNSNREILAFLAANGVDYKFKNPGYEVHQTALMLALAPTGVWADWRFDIALLIKGILEMDPDVTYQNELGITALTRAVATLVWSSDKDKRISLIGELERRGADRHLQGRAGSPYEIIKAYPDLLEKLRWRDQKKCSWCYFSRTKNGRNAELARDYRFTDKHWIVGVGLSDSTALAWGALLAQQSPGVFQVEWACPNLPVPVGWVGAKDALLEHLREWSPVVGARSLITRRFVDGKLNPEVLELGTPAADRNLTLLGAAVECASEE